MQGGHERKEAGLVWLQFPFRPYHGRLETALCFIRSQVAASAQRQHCLWDEGWRSSLRWQ